MTAKNDDDNFNVGKRNAREPPVTDGKLAIFFIILGTALVLGYLFLSKLADISQQEDCALAHRRNCGASEMLSKP